LAKFAAIVFYDAGIYALCGAGRSSSGCANGALAFSLPFRNSIETAMIHFNLACANDHEFEGWFQDSGAFSAQTKKKQIDCPLCGDTTIRKAPMAPAIGRKSGSGQGVVESKTLEAAKLHKALTKFRDHVETSCENVGDRFADEARKIHYGETEERGIYGQSSDKEAQDLKAEGVPFARMPWPRRTDG